MNICGIPAICGGRVVGAGRTDTDDIRQRAEQHIVARTRPRLVRVHHAVVIDAGIEEEVDRHPAAPRRNVVIGQRSVEIGRAVDMAGIADVVIILLRAGHREGVVPPAGVLNDLDQRQHFLIVIFRMQARHGIGMAHEGARRRHVQRMLDPLVQFGGRETFEIGALAAIDILNLDVVARLDEIGFGGGAVHPDTLQRVSQRIGQLELCQTLDDRARDHHRQRRHRVLRLQIHRAAGGRNDQHAVPLD